MGEDFSTTLDALNMPYMAPRRAFKVVSRMPELSRALWCALKLCLTELSLKFKFCIL